MNGTGAVITCRLLAEHGPNVLVVSPSAGRIAQRSRPKREDDIEIALEHDAG
jgi:hypothetical protein